MAPLPAILQLLSLQELVEMFGAGPALSRHLCFNTMDQSLLILSSHVWSMCTTLNWLPRHRLATPKYRTTGRHCTEQIARVACLCPFETVKRPPHTLRFDLRLACAVSKRKIRWSVCGIKTTDLVSLYRLRLGLKEICRRLIFCACTGKPASKSARVWCSMALLLVLCCFYPTLKWRDCGWSADSVSRISNRIHSRVSRISVLVES